MPTRMIAGQSTRLSRATHTIRYNSLHDEIVLVNPFAQAILTFRGGANGNEPPIRVIQGAHTQLKDPDHQEVDPVHGEIFIPEGDHVLVFPRTATGDTAPIRVIRGPDTQIETARSVAVDPVHDLLVVACDDADHWRVDDESTSDRGRGSLVIFGRTDNGNVKPRAVIKGSNTGLDNPNQIQVYPPKGWIIGFGPRQVTAWSIQDHGDVSPRWTLGSKSITASVRGVALNPKAKEVVIATGGDQSELLTFYFPEIF